MKGYEKQLPKTINADECFIVRLDGHSFSKFTKCLKPKKLGGGNGSTSEVLKQCRAKSIDTSALSKETLTNYKYDIYKLPGAEGPYDINFIKAMVRTTSDLVVEFGAMTGYTHSDEITLIFDRVEKPEEDLTVETVGESADSDAVAENADAMTLKNTVPQNNKKTNNNPRQHIFSGRVQKLTTLMAGYCSARFNYHLIGLV